MDESPDETRRGQAAEEAGYQRTQAIIGAIDAGMTEEQIAGALEGRYVPPGVDLIPCDRCHTPTSPRLLMSGSLGRYCPDCYDAAEREA